MKGKKTCILAWMLFFHLPLYAAEKEKPVPCSSMKQYLTGTGEVESLSPAPVQLPGKKTNSEEWIRALHRKGSVLGGSKDGKSLVLLEWKLSGECDRSIFVVIRQEERVLEKKVLYDGAGACDGKSTFEKEESLIDERVQQANLILTKYKVESPQWVAHCRGTERCPLRDGRFLFVDSVQRKLLLEDPKSKSQKVLKEAKAVMAKYPEGWEAPTDSFPFCPAVNEIAFIGNTLVVQMAYISYGPDGFNKDPEFWFLKGFK